MALDEMTLSAIESQCVSEETSHGLQFHKLLRQIALAHENLQKDNESLQKALAELTGARCIAGDASNALVPEGYASEYEGLVKEKHQSGDYSITVDPTLPSSTSVLRFSATSSKAEAEMGSQLSVPGVLQEGVTSHSLESELLEQKMSKFAAKFMAAADDVLKNCFCMWKQHVVKMNTCLSFKMRPSIVSFEQPREVGSVLGTANISKLVLKTDTSLVVRAGGCCNMMLINPGGQFRISWDIAGAVLLGWDIIMIPMSSFNLSAEDPFLMFMEWVCLIFWTWDVVMSCLTGIIEEGNTIMDIRRILNRYGKTWFALDLVVVGPDWVFTIIGAVGGSSDGAGAASTGRLLRIVRIARVARLLRLAKLQRTLSMIRDRIDSEMVFIVVNILKLVAMLLMLNHLLASIWYMIGTLARDQGGTNWIDSQKGFADESLGYRYTTALHWSICMFTPGSMAVQPTSFGERSFAILVLLFGMVVFTSFISSMTAAVGQLKEMNGNTSKDLWLLRRYLRERRVESDLAFRILRYVDYALGARKQAIPEKKVVALSLLSSHLHTELRYEVSFVALRVHPLMDSMRRISSQTMYHLVGSVLTQESFAAMDWVLKGESEAKKMFVVSSGEQHYVKDIERAIEGCAIRVGKDDWLCEAALYTRWFHLGSAQATIESELVGINATSLIDAIQSDVPLFAMVIKYAKKFVMRLNKTTRGKLTDVGKYDEDARILADFLDDDRRSFAQRKPLLKRTSTIG